PQPALPQEVHETGIVGSVWERASEFAVQCQKCVSRQLLTSALDYPPALPHRDNLAIQHKYQIARAVRWEGITPRNLARVGVVVERLLGQPPATEILVPQQPYDFL